MTTWLEFRAEPIVNEIPWVTMSKKNGKIVLTCDAIDCPWEEEANEEPGQVEAHQKWHEDGMPA